MKSVSVNTMVGSPRTHASSPITVTGVSQRFAIDDGYVYDFKTDGNELNGNCIVEFGDSTVVAVATAVTAMGTLIRWDDVSNKIRVPNDSTHFAVIGYDGGTPELFVERRDEI